MTENGSSESVNCTGPAELSVWSMPVATSHVPTGHTVPSPARSVGAAVSRALATFSVTPMVSVEGFSPGTVMQYLPASGWVTFPMPLLALRFPRASISPNARAVPGGPCGPSGPIEPRGPIPRLTLVSIFTRVTAWSLSCRVPTLLGGRRSAA